MKILTKFVGSSVAIAGIILSVNVSSEVLLKQAETAMETSHEKVDRASSKVLNLKVSLRDQISALKSYLILDRYPGDMAKYHKSMSEFLLTLDDLETLMLDNSDLALVRRRHRFLVRLATDLREKPSSSEQTIQDFRTINSYEYDIKFYLDLLVRKVQQQDAIARIETNQFKRNTQIIRYTSIGLMLVIFCGYIFLILLPVVRSIQQLQIGAAKIGAGNLDYRLNIQTKDEIEQLAREFNQMAEKLAESYYSLEQKVVDRTAELTNTNQKLQSEIADRQEAEAKLKQALKELKKTQSQLIQTEKMSSLGQLVAGVAHEINNPVNFIYGNLTHADEYIQNLLELINLYRQGYSNTDPEVEDLIEDADLEFLIEDLPQLVSSMKVGANRIREIVLTLRNFSRLDEAEMKPVNIHEGIDSTLLILQNQLKNKPDQPGIHIIKQYGNLPPVECYAGQLNQVFMNILSNAIDALHQYNKERLGEGLNYNPGTITIQTQTIDSDWVAICIKDNGSGMTQAVKEKLFDPFFTTKPVGQGTGLGLSISYQIIVDQHGGSLKCLSEPGQGAEFWIKIPVRQSSNLKLDPDRQLNHQHVQVQ